MTSEIPVDDFYRHQRRAAISRHFTLTGLDYIEVINQKQLLLHFVPNASGHTKQIIPPNINIANISLTKNGGVANNELRVQEITYTSDNTLTVNLSQVRETATLTANFPVYTLEFVNVPTLDPFFSQATFSLEVDSPFDTLRSLSSSPLPSSELEINYLAKDYASFRQLMLDRLSVLMPQWKERNPADLGIALIEILASVADRLSYYQDAVATEAYLGTARRRISVKRHARLIDYTVHEGCNSRVWVQIQVNADIYLPKDAQFLTRLSGAGHVVIFSSDLYQAGLESVTFFKSLEENKKLFVKHNEIYFYTWGAKNFYLPVGASRATLLGKIDTLKPGDVLILEEKVNWRTGSKEEADFDRRHAVRLTKVQYSQDMLGGQFQNPPSNAPVEITQIEWHEQDALPFPFYISVQKDDFSRENISAVRGNIVLADCGRNIKEELPTVPTTGRYRPSLRYAGLTHAVPYDSIRSQEKPASETLVQDPREAVPILNLKEVETGEVWRAKRDLLSSDRFSRDFVGEIESDGFIYLRFGNNVYGKQPTSNLRLQAEYRVGNGVQGNVGREAIAHILCDSQDMKDISDRITKVRNPLPAKGGSEPETIEQVRLYAPQVFRSQQQRCVTSDDYKTTVERHPEVQKAAATIRWTGSWYTVFIAVQRRDNRALDLPFKQRLLDFIEPYRLAGYDLEILAPSFVFLDIVLQVKVGRGYFSSTVKQMLLEVFSNADLPSDKRGLFHPDRLNFGQSIYWSQIVKAAMEVPGVVRVKLLRFQRWGQATEEKIRNIGIGPLEIARLDNDSTAPERGIIAFELLEDS